MVESLTEMSVNILLQKLWNISFWQKFCGHLGPALLPKDGTNYCQLLLQSSVTTHLAHSQTHPSLIIAWSARCVVRQAGASTAVAAATPRLDRVRETVFLLIGSRPPPCIVHVGVIAECSAVIDLLVC
jgi:hypothetical protein